MPIEGTATGRAFIETDPHFWTGRDGNPPLHRIEALVFGEAPHVNQGLAVANRPVGVLAVAGPEDTPELRSTLRAIAEVAAIAVGNQLRRQQRDEVRDSLIFALARLAESRDPETGTHLERVQIYCRLLAERMRASSAFLGIIDNDFVENLFRSAPLHDIGKVGVPDRILRKPGKLTAEEFELMKQHAKIGGDTLHAVMRQGRTHAFLQMGMEIAYCHHERFDGSGYPQGLKGESIPLAARILALADVYDALTTQRVYKAAMGHAEARELIIKERGRHFDPAVVDAFLEGLEDFDRTRQALADVVGETAERTHTPTMTGPAPRGPVPETPRE
jgi:response regulator RpfG family c-di-GMP phosphodiesterase